MESRVFVVRPLAIAALIEGCSARYLGEATRPAEE